MVSDLISKQDAIRAVANYLWHYPNEQYKNLNVFEVGESLVKDALSIVPSADRPTGEWIFNPKDAIELMFTLPKCSECGFESSDVGNYCSNCGAKMGGDD